eukprot:CAMPEP_0168560754 /NCGR_PEP_ID=MMETSP0413-20121227/11230_1 /TAXON_ID=136452 /ORGANISM="Filamoeba nolandi, Strain NC-AS-23-1" /LENGTH=345 /DNA_ID=CAMNT_0008592079 /DNA_START=60 /DNA_END=1097 /DNA_ORIENTATION=-
MNDNSASNDTHQVPQPTWLKPLKGHTKSIQCLEINEANGMLASGSDDKTVRIWDLKTGKSVRCLTGFSNPVNAVAFDSAGTNSLFAASGNSLFSFDLRKPSVILSEFEKVSFNSDEINQMSVRSNFIALCDDAGEIKVLKLEQQSPANQSEPKIELFRTLRKQHSNICTSVRFHPTRDGEVISGGLDGKVIVWDFNKLKQLMSFDLIEKNSGNQIVNPAFVFSLDISSDQPLIAVGLGDHTIAILSTRLKKKIASLEQHTSSVSQVIFTPFDQRYLISGGNDAKIILWKLGDESSIIPKTKNKFQSEVIYSIQHESKINWMVCDKSKKLYVADQSNAITVLELAT